MALDEIVKELLPPDLKPTQRYRVINFLVIVLLIIHMIWAFAGGYARADEVAQIKANVDSILLLSLQARMRDLSTEMCGARPATVTVLQKEIDSLQGQHKIIAGSYYTIVVQCSPHVAVP